MNYHSVECAIIVHDALECNKNKSGLLSVKLNTKHNWDVYVKENGGETKQGKDGVRRLNTVNSIKCFSN